jgi:hypothetical protein
LLPWDIPKNVPRGTENRSPRCCNSSDSLESVRRGSMIEIEFPWYWGVGTRRVPNSTRPFFDGRKVSW